MSRKKSWMIAGALVLLGIVAFYISPILFVFLVGIIVLLFIAFLLFVDAIGGLIHKRQMELEAKEAAKKGR